MDNNVGSNLFSVRKRMVPILSRMTIALAGLLLLATGCATMKPLESQLASDPVNIDGALNEWSGSMENVAGKALRMGLRHDNEFVYVSLQSIDELMLQRIMLGGLTLWFNSEGNRTRNLGIRYPLPRSSESPLQINSDFQPTATNVQPIPLSELELTDGRGNSARWPIQGVPGLEVKSFLEYGSFSYELKIPIRQGPDRQISLSPGPEGIWALGIETGAVQIGGAPNPADPSDGAAASGGRRGRRGGGSGSAGTSGSGSNTGLDPIEVWVLVSLGSGS